MENFRNILYFSKSKILLIIYIIWINHETFHSRFFSVPGERSRHDRKLHLWQLCNNDIKIIYFLVKNLLVIVWKENKVKNFQLLVQVNYCTVSIPKFLDEEVLFNFLPSSIPFVKILFANLFLNCSVYLAKRIQVIINIWNVEWNFVWFIKCWAAFTPI